MIMNLKIETFNSRISLVLIIMTEILKSDFDLKITDFLDVVNLKITLELELDLETFFNRKNFLKKILGRRDRL